MNTITGEDVLGVPGQNLTADELRLIVHLADGTGKNEIIEELHSNTIHIRQLESSLRAKLGAKTKTHIVARGFVLGVLMTRALCLCLIIGTGYTALTSVEVLRLRNQQTTRKEQADTTYA